MNVLLIIGIAVGVLVGLYLLIALIAAVWSLMFIRKTKKELYKYERNRKER